MEQIFFNAGNSGHLEDLESYLRTHPNVDINQRNTHGRAVFHNACAHGHHEVVKLLLALPALDVNMSISKGNTPFAMACINKRRAVVELLLKDPRVDITLGNNNQLTPVWLACYYNHFEVIEWLVASGRDLGDLEKKVPFEGSEFAALEIARREKNLEATSLLKRFMADPHQTRHEVLVKLGFGDALAAEHFATIVFLCDDLLQLKPALAAVCNDAGAPAAIQQFFAIAKRLPMELQMVLCHRVAGSRKQNIKSTESEAAFKSLARTIFVNQKIVAML